MHDVWTTGSGTLFYELTGLTGGVHGTTFSCVRPPATETGPGRPYVSEHRLCRVPASTDFNGDGRTDFADFFLFADAFGGTDPRFDLDGSGRVDFADFFRFVDAFGS